jgi:hypothetical protein
MDDPIDTPCGARQRSFEDHPQGFNHQRAPMPVGENAASRAIRSEHQARHAEELEQQLAGGNAQTVNTRAQAFSARRESLSMMLDPVCAQ